MTTKRSKCKNCRDLRAEVTRLKRTSIEQRTLNRLQSRTLVSLAAAVIASYERSRSNRPENQRDLSLELIQLGKFAGAALRLELMPPDLRFDASRDTPQAWRQRIQDYEMNILKDGLELLGG